ncbi:hypothetical protein BGZ49_006926 [Haplosporangium sp. Z 27]|nr:hypothetical protein BGZ49_006926 [Haplosporangium sp. Z 27]
METLEPWRCLIEVVTALIKYYDDKVDIPEMPDISSLSNERQGLYRSAYDGLLVYKFDGKQTVSKKDASVALSCTLSDSARNAHVLNISPNHTAHILKRLREVLEKNDVKSLQEEVQIL